MAAAVLTVGRRSISHLRCLSDICRRPCSQSSLIRSTRLSRVVCLHRQLQTSAVSRAEASAGATASGQGETPGAQGSGIFSTFWKWLTTDGGSEKVMTMEEKLQRDALLEKVQDMYFAKPPISPDLEYYREVFETLIKFNDRIGVDTLWHFMGEMKVVPDQQLKDLVESYLEKTKQERWFD